MARTERNSSMSLEDKMKILNASKSKLEKAFGKGVLITSKDDFPKIQRFSSGFLGMDEALGINAETGIGGYPRGRIIEIYGEESSGKTTLTLHAIAEAQKCGDICAFIDAEHSFDPVYAKALGVNVDSLLLSQPSSGEEALEIVEELTKTGVVGLIIVDSVSALVPQAEIDGDMGDSHVGLQARLMGQAMRKLVAPISSTGTTIIFLNQIRMLIGIKFGDPRTQSGGKALKFYASIRIEVQKGSKVTKSDEVIANKSKVKIIKNKTAPPYRTAEFFMEFGTGIDITKDLILMAEKKGILVKKGAWYSLSEENIGQGIDKTKIYLEENPEIYEDIKLKVMAKLLPDTLTNEDIIKEKVEETTETV